MKVYFLVRFSKRTGKIDTSMDAYGKGLISMWALQNTTSSKCTFVFDQNGWIVGAYEGTKDGFPKVTRYHEGEEHINEHCEGLLYECLQKCTREIETVD